MGRCLGGHSHHFPLLPTLYGTHLHRKQLGPRHEVQRGELGASAWIPVQKVLAVRTRARFKKKNFLVTFWVKKRSFLYGHFEVLPRAEMGVMWSKH